MKEFFLFIIILLLSISNLKAQQINRLYNDGLNDIASDIEKYNDNSYYISGSYSTAGDRIKNVDSLGNLIQEVILFNGNQQQRAIYNSLEIINNKIYFLTKQTIYGDPNEYSFAFTCFDLNFDTIWNYKYLVSENSVFANTFMQTEDGGFAIAGNNDGGTSNSKAFIFKIDSLGNYQWYQTYGYSNGEAITSIVQTEDNGFIIAGASYKYNQSYNDWYIVRTDSLGNQIWDWILRNPENNVPNIDNMSDGPIADLIQTQDGNFIAVGGKSYTNDPFLLKKSRLLKFDIDKNIIIDTLYTEVYENDGVDANYESEFVKIKEKENGNLLLLNKHQCIPGDNGYRITNLYELDQELSIISKRNFGAIAYSSNNGEYLRDFLIEEDGSLAMIGDVYLNSYFFEPPYQRVWFVKTDENYCDGFGSCDTNIAIHFFPPDTIVKTDTVNLEFELISNWDIAYNVEFTFFHKNINRITYDTLFNIIAGDIYQIEVSYENLVNENLSPNYQVEDTVFIMCQIYPSDSLSKSQYNTTIQENRIIFVESHEGIEEIKNKRGFSIYPNPTNGILNVEYINLDGSSTINIYDLKGTTLKSFKVEKDFGFNTYNVSDLSKGVYLIGFGKGQTTKFIVK